MRALCFATNNQHKILEISHMLNGKFNILSLKEIGCTRELPETGDTLEGNSMEKAKFIYENYKLNCFSDDTGLEVESLGGDPGIYSARYAGPEKNSQENVKLLLKKLQNITNRKARFRTVITLILEGNTVQFDGIVYGSISRDRRGDHGFGYDPVFMPEGYHQTFAELSLEQKNKISHRSIALHKLVDYLQSRSHPAQ